MEPELVVALDVPSARHIAPIVDALPDDIRWYKVGLELFVAEGPRALAPLRERGAHIFLDLKLHDIPRTVARAVTSAARLEAGLLTVHAAGGPAMLAAAADAAADAGPNLKLVAVTTLTSLDQSDLQQMGITRPLTEHTLALGAMAVSAGIHGLVCSVHEAAEFRRVLGPEPLLVTPGIRPAGGDVGDQKRVATPGDAVQAGASFLVVGRPIVQADNPEHAARRVLQEIKAAAS